MYLVVFQRYGNSYYHRRNAVFIWALSSYFFRDFTAGRVVFMIEVPKRNTAINLHV